MSQLFSNSRAPLFTIPTLYLFQSFLYYWSADSLHPSNSRSFPRPPLSHTLSLSLSSSLSPEDIHPCTSVAICYLPWCTQRIDCSTEQHPKCNSVYQQQWLCTCADDNGLEAVANSCKVLSVYSPAKTENNRENLASFLRDSKIFFLSLHKIASKSL
jgi:hypothetical protein